MKDIETALCGTIQLANLCGNETSAVKDIETQQECDVHPDHKKQK